MKEYTMDKQEQKSPECQNKNDSNKDENTVLKRMNDEADEGIISTKIPDEITLPDKEKKWTTLNAESICVENQDDQNREDKTVLKNMNGETQMKNVDKKTTSIPENISD